jgi:hypothetical protein
MRAMPGGGAEERPEKAEADFDQQSAQAETS